MIYTRAQLDEVIEAAERRGWGPPPWNRVWSYRGFPIGYDPKDPAGQWNIAFLERDKPEHSGRCAEIPLAPWLVDEVAELNTEGI